MNKNIVMRIILLLIASALILFGLAYAKIPKPYLLDSPVSPSPIPSSPAYTSGMPITLSGEFVCLPHRNTSGPQTMECAFGLKTPEGMYYALRDSDPTYKHISSIATGKKGTVTGMLEKREDKKYPTEGVIVIDSIQ